MDRNTERAYDAITSGADTLKDEILRLEGELSDLQDKYDTLEKDYETLEEDFEYYKINLQER